MTGNLRTKYQNETNAELIHAIGIEAEAIKRRENRVLEMMNVLTRRKIIKHGVLGSLNNELHIMGEFGGTFSLEEEVSMYSGGLINEHPLCALLEEILTGKHSVSVVASHFLAFWKDVME